MPDQLLLPASEQPQEITELVNSPNYDEAYKAGWNEVTSKIGDAENPQTYIYLTAKYAKDMLVTALEPTYYHGMFDAAAHYQQFGNLGNL